MKKITSSLRNIIVSIIVSATILAIGIILMPVNTIFATVVTTLATLALGYFIYVLIKYIIAHKPEKKENEKPRLVTHWQDWVITLTLIVAILILVLLCCRGCGNTTHFANGDTVHFENVVVDNMSVGNIESDSFVTDKADLGETDISDAFIGNSYTDYQHADSLVAEEFEVEDPNEDETESVETNKPADENVPVHNCVFKNQTQAATCKADGYTVEVCSCGKERNRTVIAKLMHNWDAGTVTQEATEYAEGTLAKKCLSCGETTYETIQKLSHIHKVDSSLTKKQDATCSESGYTRYYCSCGALQSEETLPKISKHNWDNGEITRKATETRTGIMTYTCKDCGKSMTETIDKLEHRHDYDWVIVEKATCSNDGYEEYVCEDCGDVKRTRSIEATGDCDYRVYSEEDPTSTKDGYIKYRCRNCGDTYTETIPATGEDEDNEYGEDIYLTSSHSYLEEGVTVTITTTGSTDNLEISYDPDVVAYEKISNKKITLKWLGTKNGLPAPTAVSIYDVTASNEESVIDLCSK